MLGYCVRDNDKHQPSGEREMEDNLWLSKLYENTRKEKGKKSVTVKMISLILHHFNMRTCKTKSKVIFYISHGICL